MRDLSMFLATVVVAALTMAGCSSEAPAADGGIDAGPGTSDGGAGDGGSADSGSMDAGLEPDAGGPFDAGPPDAGPPRLEESELCMAYATAFCEAIPACCSTADTVPASCVTDARGACQAQLAEVLTDSRILYDPVRAAASLAEGEALLSSCATTEFLEWLTVRDGLFDAFVGTIAGGESCEPVGTSIEEQLVAALICDNRTHSCRGGAGTMNCQVRGAIGVTCTYATDCQDSLRCVRPGTGLLATGSCESTGEALDSHCRLDGECASLNCTAPNYLVPGVCAEATADAIYCPAE